MSHPGSPHTHDLDAVLRDDVALEQISRGRRPRGADHALKLLCALAEDVDVRVPRRRMRGSRFTRGVIATAVAGTVLGVTGVAAAQPDDQGGGFALWAPQPDDAHVRVADRSLTEARMSLAEGRTMEASAALDRADAQLSKAGRSKRADQLRNVSVRLRSQADLPSRARPSQPTRRSSCLWGGLPDNARTVLVCGGGKTTKQPWPQPTPGASGSTPGSLRPLLSPPISVQPTTPGWLPPSSLRSPSAHPTGPTTTGGDHSTPSKSRPRPTHTP